MNEKIHALMNHPALIQNRDQWFDKLTELFNGEYRGPLCLHGRVGCHVGSLACPDQRDILGKDPAQALEIGLADLAADHLEAYVKGLREDQVIYFSPTANMPLEESLRVSRGKRMVYVGDFHLESFNG